jgi:hypothetical protein
MLRRGPRVGDRTQQRVSEPDRLTLCVGLAILAPHRPLAQLIMWLFPERSTKKLAINRQLNRNNFFNVAEVLQYT